jgi:uncharacterized FAD-dependent dehydrogenase
MLMAMDKLIPGVGSPDTLMYGIEVKFYSFRPKLSFCMETEVRNMFAVGDGTGVSRGWYRLQRPGGGRCRNIETKSRAKR